MCSRVFVVAYCGLVLATAGFCLTIAGWFTPANNGFVYNVRRAGPVLLVFGGAILVASCLMCAVEQDRCFETCIRCYEERKRRIFQRHLARAVVDLHAARNHLGQPDRVVLDRLHHSCEVCDAIRHNYVLYMPPRGHECDSPERHRHIHCDLDPNCDLEFSPNQTARLGRFLSRNQSRSLPPSCGYQGSDETTDCGEAQPPGGVHDRIFYGSDRIRHAHLATGALGNPDQGTSQSDVTPSVFSSPRWSYAKHVLASETPRDSTDEATRSTPTTTSPIATPASGRKYCIDDAAAPRLGYYRSIGDLMATGRQTADDLVWTPRTDSQNATWRNESADAVSISPYKVDKKSYASIRIDV